MTRKEMQNQTAHISKASSNAIIQTEDIRSGNRAAQMNQKKEGSVATKTTRKTPFDADQTRI